LYEESRLLWDNYVLNKSNDGIIIQLELKDLADLFQKSKYPITPCYVKYIDINNSAMGTFNVIKFFSRKPNKFHWEHEIRFILKNDIKEEDNLNYIYIDMDLSKIKNIILSPYASEEFKLKIKRQLNSERILDSKIRFSF
jgi:hypothetical protein